MCEASGLRFARFALFETSLDPSVSFPWLAVTAVSIINQVYGKFILLRFICVWYNHDFNGLGTAGLMTVNNSPVISQRKADLKLDLGVTKRKKKKKSNIRNRHYNYIP